jgi:hypothetical protein
VHIGGSWVRLRPGVLLPLNRGDLSAHALRIGCGGAFDCDLVLPRHHGLEDGRSSRLGSNSRGTRDIPLRSWPRSTSRKLSPATAQDCHGQASSLFLVFPKSWSNRFRVSGTLPPASVTSRSGIGSRTAALGWKRIYCSAFHAHCRTMSKLTARRPHAFSPMLRRSGVEGRCERLAAASST